jgi:hypothetical protein
MTIFTKFYYEIWAILCQFYPILAFDPESAFLVHPHALQHSEAGQKDPWLLMKALTFDDALQDDTEKMKARLWK